jgi:hypothetical protein
MLLGSLYVAITGCPTSASANWTIFSRLIAHKLHLDFQHFVSELAQVEKGGRWSASRNGKIIEQSQILTAHNLATLFENLDLHTTPLLHIDPFFRPPVLAEFLPFFLYFPAWLLPQLLGKFISFQRRVSASSAFENPQGFGAIGTATSFTEILLGTQSRNLFRHCHVDELV